MCFYTQFQELGVLGDGETCQLRHFVNTDDTFLIRDVQVSPRPTFNGQTMISSSEMEHWR